MRGLAVSTCDARARPELARCTDAPPSHSVCGNMREGRMNQMNADKMKLAEVEDDDDNTGMRRTTQGGTTDSHTEQLTLTLSLYYERGEE